MPKLSVNSPCHCKSGIKYKKCCLNKVNKVYITCNECGFNRTAEKCSVCEDVVKYSLAFSYNDRVYLASEIARKYPREQLAIYKLIHQKLGLVDTKRNVCCSICKSLIMVNDTTKFLHYHQKRGSNEPICNRCCKDIGNEIKSSK